MDATGSTEGTSRRGSFGAEMRRKLALSLDVPPPVPPKDPPRPGTSSSSRPGTSSSTRPSTAATGKTAGPPIMMGTMSSSRPGTAGTRPATATTTTEQLRPGTAVSVKTPVTAKGDLPALPAPTAAAPSRSLTSKFSMAPLKPVKITNPMKGLTKSLSLKRSNTFKTTSSMPTADEDATGRPSRRFSRSTTMTGKTIKYGVGKHAAVELSPQPSDDENDPLNWPVWKKDLNLVSLAIMASLANAMKTAFIPVGADLATQFGVSQVDIAALTAVPLILSSLTSLASLTVAKLYGKRPVYLLSAALLFIGSMWNMRAPSFGQAMGARFFQGLAWGAFDTLLLGSIHDSYFEHERHWRLAAYDMLCVLTTWAPPIFGGVAARNSGRYTLHFEIINAFYIVAIPLLLLAAPETAYDRWFSGSSGLPLPTPMETRRRSLGRFEVSVPTAAGMKTFLKTMKPLSDFRGFFDSRTLLQGPRAFVAPTTILLALLTFLPAGALWGLAHTLSPLFGPALDPAQLASLLAAPLVLSILAPALLLLWRRGRTETDLAPRPLTALLATGTALVFTGLLAFGMETRVFRAGEVAYPLLSVLLGLVAAGTYILAALARPLVWRSARFTGSNLHVCLRNVADMDAGVRCWRGLLTGVLVLAFASAVQRAAAGDAEAVAGTAGVRAGCVAVAVAQVLLAGLVGAVFWFRDERVRRLDGKVMGFVDLSMLKRSESFFDHT